MRVRAITRGRFRRVIVRDTVRMVRILVATGNSRMVMRDTVSVACCRGAAGHAGVIVSDTVSVRHRMCMRHSMRMRDGVVVTDDNRVVAAARHISTADRVHYERAFRQLRPGTRQDAIRVITEFERADRLDKQRRYCRCYLVIDIIFTR